MRDLLILAIVFGSVPLAAINPYYGILAWSWISYMNPHRLSWSVAYSFPVAVLVGAGTLVGILARGFRGRIPMERETVLLLLLWMTFLFTTMFAEYPEPAWSHWIQVSKILLMTAATLLLCQDRRRLRVLTLTIALSIGFYGFKGGIFSLATGGRYRVWGPSDTFIGDNNSMALALLMVLPMLHYLARETVNRWGKLLLRGTFFLSVISVIFSYSRGGFLGLAAVIFALTLKARRRLLVATTLAVAVALGAGLIPQAWYDRMNTIQDYQEDTSATGRLNAWSFAWNLALDRPLTGGGFDTFEPEMFYRYAPDPLSYHDAHSIYFETLGEHGFPGLLLFLGLLLSTVWSLRGVRKRLRGVPDSDWLVDYSHMIEVSIIGFMVSGSFLGLAYFDLFYHVIALAVLVKTMARSEELARQPGPA